MPKAATFYRIESWMYDELELTGARLNVYAVVYSYTSKASGFWYGSSDNLAKMAGCCRSVLYKVLNSLIADKLIVRVDDKKGIYKAIKVRNTDRKVRNTDTTVRNTDTQVRNTDTSSPQYGHNIDSNNIIIQIVDTISICAPRLSEVFMNKMVSAHGLDKVRKVAEKFAAYYDKDAYRFPSARAAESAFKNWLEKEIEEYDPLKKKPIGSSIKLPADWKRA